MRPKSRPAGNTGLKVLLLVLYEVALLKHGGEGVGGLCRPPLRPLPTHDPVHECTLLFILLLLMLAAIHLYQQAGLRIRIQILGILGTLEVECRGPHVGEL